MRIDPEGEMRTGAEQLTILKNRARLRGRVAYSISFWLHILLHSNSYFIYISRRIPVHSGLL